MSCSLTLHSFSCTLLSLAKVQVTHKLEAETITIDIAAYGENHKKKTLKAYVCMHVTHIQTYILILLYTHRLTLASIGKLNYMSGNNKPDSRAS